MHTHNLRFFATIMLALCLSCTAKDSGDDSVNLDTATVFLDADRFMPFYWNMVWPHAIMSRGKIFCAFQNSNGQPVAVSYDVAEQRWSEPVLVSAIGLRRRDTHGNPAIYLDPEGYVHLFYGSHVSAAFHARSKQPYDIQAWEHLDVAAAHATYAQAFRLGDDRLYLFFRDGFHYDAWQMMVSEDDGEHWTQMEDVIDLRREPVDIYAGAYANFRPGSNGETIHCFFVRKDDNPRLVGEGLLREHPQGGVKYPGLGEAVYRFNLYYMQRNATGTWTNAAGDALPLPVTRRTADESCLVEDSGDLFAGVRGVVVGDGNVPYVHYTTGVRDWQNGGPEIVPTRHWYARLTPDGTWERNEGLPAKWPAEVRKQFAHPNSGGVVAGETTGRDWVFDFEYDDEGRSLLYLRHLEDGFARRPGGAVKSPVAPHVNAKDLREADLDANSKK